MLSAEAKRQLFKKMRTLFQRYADLDDALWYLSTDPAMVRARIRQYQIELSGLLKTETVKEEVVRQDITKSLESFEKNLLRFIAEDEYRKRLPRMEALQNAVYEQYANQIDIVTSQIGNTLGQRAAQFRAMSQAAEIPIIRAEAVEGYTIRAVNLGGKQYNAVQLGKYWKRMLNEYGTRGSIMYRNGANYPLTSYIDQRLQTSAAETDRLTAVVTSSALGLTLGKINQTGTTDSCIYWENKYVFMSDEAKAQTIAKYPKMTSLKDIPTVQDVRADKTHMFKWNCKHRILPTAITVLDEGEFAEEFERTSAVQPKVPKKIKEADIYKQITGDKYAPKEGGQIERMRDAAEIDVREVSYTIQ